VAPPSICNGSQCSSKTQTTFGQFEVILYSAPSTTSGTASVIELLDNTAPVYWKVIDGDSPEGVTCSTTPAPNCVVVDETGAHASTFSAFRVSAGALTQFDMNGSDTPASYAADLNGDGWIDVVTEQNTYQPNYAAGTVYWQTFTSNGVHLLSTGCSAPIAADQLAPRPSAPLGGPCTA
jgi:hypothetical protein